MRNPVGLSYGFVFGTRGEAGIIEEHEGGYNFRRMDIRPVDLEKDMVAPGWGW